MSSPLNINGGSIRVNQGTNCHHKGGRGIILIWGRHVIQFLQHLLINFLLLPTAASNNLLYPNNCQDVFGIKTVVISLLLALNGLKKSELACFQLHCDNCTAQVIQS